MPALVVEKTPTICLLRRVPGYPAVKALRAAEPTRSVGMLEHHEAISEPSNPDATLWRFMDFTKYVAMLHRRALFFARADQLPDPFEGMYARRNLPVEAGTRAEHGHGLRQRVFLSCWHRNPHESAAMWRIYLSSEDGVAVRSNVARLRAALAATPERLHLGKVRYLDYRREFVPERHALDPFFCKRKSFDYEREVRVLWQAHEAVEQPGRYLAADLEQLVEQVVIAPNAEPWLEDLVRSVTEKYGFQLHVRASSMLDPPDP